MSLSEFDKVSINRIMQGQGDWFTAQVLRLCGKADPNNLARLRQGFPEEVAAYEAWYHSYNTPVSQGLTSGIKVW